MDTFPTIPLAPTPGATAPSGGPNAFPPIAEYAFIADLEVTALIAPSGNVEWLCVPRPDAPSVFGAVLDRSAGTFRLGPAELFAPAGRRYIPGTNILETTWHTSTGWLVVRDALIVGPWSDDRRIRTYRRPPPDNVSEHVLVRELRCVNGRVDVQMSCEPVFDYGRNDAAWEYSSAGYGEAVARGAEDDPLLRLTTSMRLGLEGRSALAAHQMEEGDRDFVALSWSDDEPPLTYEDAAARMRCTASFWRGWLNQGVFPDHPWRGVLQRSALTLKGLTYAPTGALLAAATTSLPESPGGERNWDYRYSWVRDATFALWALYTLGFDYEANSFFYFIADQIGDGSPLKVLYAVDDGVDLKESTLDHLAGYEDSRPVRIGNDAHDQEQHDIWGGARCTRCTCTRARASSCPASPGTTSNDRSSARSIAGASPTAASGRTAESRATSRRPRSCAGWRWIAAHSSRRRWATPTWSSAGAASPTRSSRTCWSTASTSEGCSRSPTGRRRSTPRCSSGSCWASCRRTIRGCARRSSRSPRS